MRPVQTTSGFTMIELLVALSIGTIVILMASLVFVEGVRHARVIAGEAKLVSAAAHLTDVLTYNIRPATSVASPAANQLEVTKTDGTTDTIELTGGKIELGGNSILPPNIIPNQLSFTIIDSSTIQVHYELSIDIGSHPDFIVTPFSATTTIALRNI